MEITNNFSNVTEYKINLQGLIICLHNNNKHSEKEIRYIPSHNNLQEHDASRNKLTKEFKDLNNNNDTKNNNIKKWISSETEKGARDEKPSIAHGC